MLIGRQKKILSKILVNYAGININEMITIERYLNIK